MSSRAKTRFSGLDTSRIPGQAYGCPVCRELFSSEKTFVFHRVSDRTPPGRPASRLLGPCQDPASKGMALDGNGVWKWYPAPVGGDEAADSPRSGHEAEGGTYPPLSTTRFGWPVCKRCGEQFEPARPGYGDFCGNDCRVKYRYRGASLEPAL